MPSPVKPRRYDSSRRAESASTTRRAILQAAFRLFVEQGYERTTMTAIAKEAGVAADTVYASAGRKPQLCRLLVESVIASGDQAVPALERDYVRAVRAEPTASAKLRLYAAAVARIHLRLAPLMLVIRDAATTTPELAQFWREIAERRAANMRLFAQELLDTGELRPDLDLGFVADTIWAMNAPEFYALLVIERGWTSGQFGEWLCSAWERMLLRAPQTA